LLGSVYLLMSMLWAGHFQIGYVMGVAGRRLRIRVFWAVMIAVFAVLGGGPLSVDNAIRQKRFSKPVAAALRAHVFCPVVACMFEHPHGVYRLDIGFALLLSITPPLSAREVRVGVLIDGPSAREGIDADALEHAAAAVYGDGLTLTIAPQSRLNGNWSAPR